MHNRKFLNIVITLIVLTSLVFGGSLKATAAPAVVDPAKNPHYFGPYPNWANSPMTMADAAVAITGDGAGATAVASVNATGAVTGITITNPGSGYTTATVAITGTGTGAAADAVINPGGVVTAINVSLGGAGYVSPSVSITGGGPLAVPASVTPVAVDTFSVNVGSALGGTFLLNVDGVSTAPIAYNAIAADVQAALTGSTVVGAGSIADPWIITLAPAPTLFSIDGAGLILPAAIAATAAAFGGVDAVTVIDPGSGYTMPTIDFDLPDDPNGVQASGHVTCVEIGCQPTAPGTPVTITGVVVDNPGSGYAVAPNAVIRDGTIFDPVARNDPNIVYLDAAATTTLTIQSVVLNTFGSGYTSAPTVNFADSLGAGSGAAATAITDVGAVTGIANLVGGSGYITTGGIKKFQDGLPTLCIPTAGQTFADCTNNNLGQHIPVGVADTTTFSKANGFSADADYYVIALVQHREQMSSSLPATGTLLREYVQLETSANASISKHVALQNDLFGGGTAPALMPDGSQAYAVDDPHFLGPVLVATKDKPVRIVFYNLLPTGTEGNLFLPVDSTMMGSGMGPMAMADPADQGTVLDMVRNPMCTENPQDPNCFKNNRATLHLHGGTTPWISDGTAHQWTTPANENTQWPQGVSVQDVPDMVNVPGVPSCNLATDGCLSFYYTNQQSARLLFYHDHAWGITRLNVYAGEAAGYVITDPTEQKLIGAGGALAGFGYGIPLVIQDRTFVPSPAQIAQQDPTWDYSRWGKEGDLWYHHVYMPAQNPGDPSGMSAYGRWMYGPWFWPPAGTAKYQPIANPYYDPNCNLDVPSTWQYQTDPFCEPQLIPGTPNISVGMEQFNDTPIVNGTAYPTTTVQPQSYRFRILNAANDRFWNLQWYVADPTTGTNSEVALKAAEVAAAQTDVNVFPTPDTLISPAGPSWIQIGSEAGFLPAPVVVPNQPITWITDPTRFDVGNVDKHALLLAPAERADVIVDFSKYAGKTLILYNDAPAAFPARVASYDYYTGGQGILPGYGPNTRTIMQVVVAQAAPAPAFNLTALQNAFKHHADGTGVFEEGQHPIIVGQAAYNSAYGTSFAASSWCNAPGSTVTRCDGYARISEQGGDLLGFNTLKAPNAKMAIKLEPKALHDEMNSASFDEFGRMTANLGLEAVPANPAAQNIILYPFVNPPTELIDGTNLPTGGTKITPISSAADGTQIWKITHNGVDTHPIHFHLYDVQVLNRVTWDNIIIPPDATELGWKDTVRTSPLEDTIVALRPIVPSVPFEVPNSVRLINPMMPAGDTSMFNNVDPAGNPTANIVNKIINFGWEYTYHCHILSHEEMDMMRPVSLALPPAKPTWPTSTPYTISGTGKNTRLTLNWNDNSITETAFVIQSKNANGTWSNVATVAVPLAVTGNIHQARSFIVPGTYNSSNIYVYRIVAQNTVGYGAEFPSMTVQSVSDALNVGTAPAAPTALAGTLQAPLQISLTWVDNAANESNFVIERSTNGGAFSQIATPPARSGTGGTVTFVDTALMAAQGTATTYAYRVTAVNLIGPSAPATTSVTVPAIPATPLTFTATNGANSGNSRSIVLTWTANTTNVTGFTIQRATNSGFTGNGVVTTTVAANATTLTVTGLSRNTNYYFRIRANNGTIIFSGWLNATPFPRLTNP